MIYEPIQVYEGDGIDRNKGLRKITRTLVYYDGKCLEVFPSKYRMTYCTATLRLFFKDVNGIDILNKALDFSSNDDKLPEIQRIRVYGLGTFSNCCIINRSEYGSVTEFLIKFEIFVKEKR
jgi:hypothetical protein